MKLCDPEKWVRCKPYTQTQNSMGGLQTLYPDLELDVGPCETKFLNYKTLFRVCKPYILTWSLTEGRVARTVRRWRTAGDGGGSPAPPVWTLFPSPIWRLGPSPGLQSVSTASSSAVCFGFVGPLKLASIHLILAKRSPAPYLQAL